MLVSSYFLHLPFLGGITPYSPVRILEEVGDLSLLIYAYGRLRQHKSNSSEMSNINIKIVESPEEFTAIQAIRISVFQEEQEVDSVLDFDGKDDISEHLIAYLDKEVVGTARIRYLDAETAKIERLAVLSKFRSQGIGTKIMQKGLEIIASKNILEAVIHSQEYVKNLYKKLDFTETGEIFYEAGIPHIKMSKKLLQAQ